MMGQITSNTTVGDYLWKGMVINHSSPALKNNYKNGVAKSKSRHLEVVGSLMFKASMPKMF